MLFALSFYSYIVPNKNFPNCKLMLRKCKVDVAVQNNGFCYNEITKPKENFMMKLSDKIITLRKSNGWSQEDLAEQLNVSRQAISRWENGTALPDANNILQLSKLFNVTTDYLLNEDYSSDDDIPCVKEVHNILESKKVRYGKLFLIASIAFLLSAVAWLIQAVNCLDVIYCVLAVVNALLSLVNIILYEKGKKTERK